MAKDFDETLAAARVQAETQLDDVLAIMRDELGTVPTQHRFEAVLMIMTRLEIDPFVVWVGYAIALERLLVREELDQDLAPPE